MNYLTAIDFFGKLCWTGGSEEEHMDRLHEYEQTGFAPEQIRQMRDAGLHYEAEITRLEALLMRRDEQIKALKSAIERDKEDEL